MASSAFSFGPAPPPGTAAAVDEKPLEKKDPGPSLLWDENVELDPDNPDYAAMMALKEGLTPDENAEAYKEQGNECLRRKRAFYYRAAVKCYTQAIDEKTGHAEHNSVYHSNRAHAELLLGNHAKALADAIIAIGLNAENLKAYYRAAKAAIGLKRFEEVLSYSQEGLKRDPENAELKGFVKTATDEIAAKKLSNLRIKEAEDGADRLLAVLREKGLRFGRPQFGAQATLPWVDGKGRLHFRVLLLYPETMQVDTVEDVCEADVLSLHLDEMFGPAAPPLPWDRERAYTRDKVQLVAEVGYPAWSQARVRAWLLEGTPGAVKEAVPEEVETGQPPEIKRVPVSESKTLMEVLRQDRLTVPGIPIFLVVSKGSAFEKVVMSGKWQVPR